MSKRSGVIMYPKVSQNLATVGSQIKKARLRRNLSVELVASRANISRSTVWQVEKGSPTVSIGIYVSVLSAIGLGDDITKLAQEDTKGILIEDENLRKRASGRRKS